MVYMSVCSVITWGVGMPWFKRRHQQKIAREKAKNVELEQHGSKQEGVEKHLPDQGIIQHNIK